MAVVVCNQGMQPWEDTPVRINAGYLANLKTLAVGDCARIKRTSYMSYDVLYIVGLFPSRPADSSTYALSRNYVNCSIRVI